MIPVGTKDLPFFSRRKPLRETIPTIPYLRCLAAVSDGAGQQRERRRSSTANQIICAALTAFVLLIEKQVFLKPFWLPGTPVPKTVFLEGNIYDAMKGASSTLGA
jgi:hypothetical protein